MKSSSVLAETLTLFDEKEISAVRLVHYAESCACGSPDISALILKVAQVLHSWKSFTSRGPNKRLKICAKGTVHCHTVNHALELAERFWIEHDGYIDDVIGLRIEH